MHEIDDSFPAKERQKKKSGRRKKKYGNIAVISGVRSSINKRRYYCVLLPCSVFYEPDVA